MSKAQNSLYPITVRTPEGKLATHRTQKLANDSLPIDDGVLAILMQFLLDYANRRNEFFRNGRNTTPAAGKFTPSGLATINWIRILNIALGFGPSNSLGSLQQVAAAHLSAQGNPSTKTKLYRWLTLEKRNPQSDLIYPPNASLFPVIPIHPNQLIEAILHADEKMVRDLLNANPELSLKEGTATDYQGRTFTGTPLQAAIATGDVAPNRNSTGLVEIILEHLRKHKPNDYQTIFEQQARELYTKSLGVYRDMQSKEIARLCKLGAELPDNDPRQTSINEKVQKALENIREYTKAVNSKDLNQLFKVHEKAQADNTFDFEPYVKAILDIDLNDPQLADVIALIDADTLSASEFSDEEIQAFKDAAQHLPNNANSTFVAKINVMASGDSTKLEHWEVRWLMHLAEKINQQDLSNSLQEKINIKTAAAIASTGVGPKETEDCRDKPFNQLTLVQKLNRFREKLVEHMKQEPIFNPNHILKALEHNENGWRTHGNQDPQYYKRMVIFSQLVGWAQRNAAESTRQNIRQGTWYITENNEQCTRPASFNEVDSSCTLENIKRGSLPDVSLRDSFKVDGFGYKFAIAGAVLRGRVLGRARYRFSKIMSSKSSKHREIYTAVCARALSQQPVRSSVM